MRNLLGQWVKVGWETTTDISMETTHQGAHSGAMIPKGDLGSFWNLMLLLLYK